MQFSLIALQSSLTHSSGTLQNLVSEGNPTAVASFVLSLSKTLDIMSASESISSVAASGEALTTVSPVLKQQSIGMN